MSIVANDFFKEYAEEEQTIQHLICFYPALPNRRRNTLGQESLEELEVVTELDVNDLKNFTSGWKCRNMKHQKEVARWKHESFQEYHNGFHTP